MVDHESDSLIQDDVLINKSLTQFQDLNLLFDGFKMIYIIWF